MTRHALGVDIGGTGIKGAPVDVDTGTMLTERVRILTPQPATPGNVTAVVAQMVEKFAWDGPIGVGFPGVVKRGIPTFAPHMDATWINTDSSRLFRLGTGRSVTVLNDADAAGLAEVRFGAARDTRGVVAVATLGTGIGFSLFTDGILVPNMEFGHILIRGKDAELRASDSARKERGYSWKKWTRLVSEFLETVEKLLCPDLIVIGGGAVNHADRFIPLLNVRTKVVAATLGNNAGIVGAALAASQTPRTPSTRPQEEARADKHQKQAKAAL